MLFKKLIRIVHRSAEHTSYAETASCTSFVRDLAEIIANQLGVKLAPIARGEFRPGEIRSLISDISRIRTIGYAPRTSIERGYARVNASR